MRLHRFILPVDLTKPRLTITDEDMIHQWLHVFRFQEGNELVLCDGAGKEARVMIEEVKKKSVSVQIVEKMNGLPEPERKITLCCAVLKRENFELVIQKAVELGITAIQPLRTERTIKLDINLERLQKIAKEAAEQCGRSVVPAVLPLQTFNEVLKTKPQGILFDIDAPEVKAAHWKSVSHIFIGPEGGWSEVEREAAKSLLTASLGSFTLRGETAAIIASYRAVHAL